jgi:hypothetical protein
MPSIKQIICDVGLFNYITSHLQEFPSSTSDKILTVTLPIFYLYEALFLSTVATTRGLFTIGKCLVLTPFATLQSLIPSMKLSFLTKNSEFIRFAECIQFRKWSYIAIGVLVIPLIFATLFIKGVPLIGILISTLAITAWTCLLLEIEFSFFTFLFLCVEFLIKNHVFKDLFKALLYLIHAPISPFLSHDYQIKKGLMMPPPNSVKNLNHILDNSTGDAARYFLRSEQLKKLSSIDGEFIDFNENYISSFQHCYTKLCSVISLDDFPENLIEKIKLHVNKNLIDLTSRNSFVQDNNNLIDSYADKKLFLEQEQIESYNLDRTFDSLRIIIEKLDLSIDDLKTFYSNNIRKYSNLLFIELDSNNNLRSHSNNDLINIFRVYVGLNFITPQKKLDPNKYVVSINNGLHPSYNLILKDFKTMIKGHKEGTEGITVEDFILELFKKKGHFLSVFDTELMKLTKIRGSKVKGAFTQLVEEFPDLESDFTELWKILSGTKKFLNFGENYADITFEYVTNQPEFL